MNIFYIKEIKSSEEILNERVQKFPKWLKNIYAYFKIKFEKVTLKDNVIILPIKENQEISIEKAKKHVGKIIKQYNCKSVVLSKNLNNNENFKKVLNSNNIDILNGRYLFRFLVFDILDFILLKKGKKIQDIELSIMLNELDEINVKSIFLVAKNVKRLNIITNHIGLFKQIERRLYEEGIMIMVSNNKRKSLLKSDVVINMDFVEEILKEYKLNNNCVIVNISSDIKLYNKGFNGININNYNIDFESEIIPNFSGEFDNKLLYESKVYGISDLDKALEKIHEDKVVITEVIGNRGSYVVF